jgi:hypothetical protein
MPYIDKTFQLQQFGDRCFQLATPLISYRSRIKTGYPAHTEFASYDGEGLFVFYSGLCYDGASNPLQITSQTNSELALGLPHDIKYRFMRAGLIPAEGNRKIADEELVEDARAAGMPHLIADAFYEAVELFGKQFTEIESTLIEVNIK